MADSGVAQIRRDDAVMPDDGAGTANGRGGNGVDADVEDGVAGAGLEGDIAVAAPLSVEARAFEVGMTAPPTNARSITTGMFQNPVETLASLGVTDHPHPSTLASRLGEQDTASNQPTFEQLFKPFVDEILEQTRKEYAPFYTLNMWVLGSDPPSFPYYSLWPPVLRAYQVALPNLYSVPKIDFGRSVISVELRRAALLVACIQYQGAATGGDVLRGSWKSQASFLKPRTTPSISASCLAPPSPPISATTTSTKSLLQPTDQTRLSTSSCRSLNLPVNHLYANPLKPKQPPLDERLAEKDRDALMLVTAATRIPARVTAELKKKALGGDMFGFQLNLPDLEFASTFLAPYSDWRVAHHTPKIGYNPETGERDEELYERQLEEQRKLAPRTGLKRLLDYKTLLKDLSEATKQSNTWSAPIPTNHRAIHQFLTDHLGFQPTYVTVLRDLDQKRSVVFLIHQFLSRPLNFADPCVGDVASVWENWEKCLLWYMFCGKAGDAYLKAHAGFLARRFGCGIDLLNVARRVSVDDPATHLLPGKLNLVSLLVLRAASTTSRIYPGELTKALFEFFGGSPAPVVEICGSIALFNCLHRIVGMVLPEPFGEFEGEVEEWVRREGAEVGVALEDAGVMGVGSVGDEVSIWCSAGRTS
ncbi:hypothetical protein HDU67_002294 [Dinochytrium kinnereticum]|nr:hypothetical protein HDU67_002294 [Dinochytrium kinnereticum]